MRRALVGGLVLVLVLALVLVLVLDRRTSTTTSTSTNTNDRTVTTSPNAPTSRPAVRAPQAPVLGTGGERLEGEVIDVYEHPVGGVRVTLDDGRSMMTESDGAFAFDGVAEGHHAVTAVQVGSRTETTAADGRFVIRGLTADTYSITAMTPRAGMASQTVELARKDRRTVELVIRPSNIRGVVVDASGRPIEDVQVMARSEDPLGYNSVRTDEHGAFDLGGLPPRYARAADHRARLRETPPGCRAPARRDD